MGCMDSDWTYPAQDKFQWQTVLVTMMNLQNP
jgi:hypothetical protein